MIVYESDALGLGILFRVHGSAVYKALLPAVFSTIFLAAITALIPWCQLYVDSPGCTPFIHPNVIGVLISFVGFLLTFRLSYSYTRYADGAQHVHVMISKWLDSALALASFAYQNEQYYQHRPIAFGKHPQLKREDIVGRQQRWDLYEEEATLARAESVDAGRRKKQKSRFHIKKHKTKDKHEPVPKIKGSHTKSINAVHPGGATSRIPIPLRFLRRLAVDRVEALVTTAEPMTAQNIPYPSLFMQELAHLYSLLGAVAFESLRANYGGVDMPLREYIPGSPWPPVDPDALNRDVKSEYGDRNTLSSMFYFLTGTSRTLKRRTLYNAARPLGVLGGVSDNEIEALSNCQGHYAKVTLCSMWLQEFVARESLKGSTGEVGTPLITRVFQFLSGGMAAYNQARLIARVPFPFSHAQIATWYSYVILFVFPLLFAGFVTSLKLALFLNFATTLCFFGLLETSRELERPFTSPPNDLPLATFQAQFNEALISVYAAYNPNLFWEIKESGVEPSSSTEQ